MQLARASRILLFPCAVFLFGCSEKQATIQNGDLILQVDSRMYSHISSAETNAVALMNQAGPSEYLVLSGDTLRDFVLQEVIAEDLKDAVGPGKKWTVKGSCSKNGAVFTKILSVTGYTEFPGLLLMQVHYINRAKDVSVVKWVNHQYRILPNQNSPPFWSFQGSSTPKRKDWLLPLRPGFYQPNYLGLNSSDYGGGIPVTDIWRPDRGVAIGHVESVPKPVWMPVDFKADPSAVRISIEFDYPEQRKLLQGDTLSTATTFVLLHHGDYYQGLKQYGLLLRKLGMKFAEPASAAYESSWCAWGYGRDFTTEEILKTLPKVKELGIKWVTIDDGFHQTEGDWELNRRKFPQGDQQMKALVDAIHANGLKAMIWWAPLAANPQSNLLKQYPDIKLMNKDGSARNITWWNAYYLSPTNPLVVQHTRDVVHQFIAAWGFDGIKMDGQHLNAVPPDYNPKALVEHPEEAYESLPNFFKMIYETSEHLKPGVVIQNCPCGTCMSVYNMPYMNQAVASDPMSSWQVRHKGKTYKAILGKTAYFGDHIELSDNKSDFASPFGVGAVLGTKFTWPKDNPTAKESNRLTPEREGLWKQWFALYERKMLSKNEYRGELYDIGYDIPETHVIQKGDTLHYAMYNKDWNGNIQLHGLEAKRYRVRDYVNKVDYGVVTGPRAEINATFENALLLEVFPEGN